MALRRRVLPKLHSAPEPDPIPEQPHILWKGVTLVQDNSALPELVFRCRYWSVTELVAGGWVACWCYGSLNSEGRGGSAQAALDDCLRELRVRTASRSQVIEDHKAELRNLMKEEAMAQASLDGINRFYISRGN
jgi:hypothetical protein